MIWGADSVTSTNLSRAKSQGKVLLGFNEPDLGAQANLTPARALELWPQLAATGMRLGSPSVAYGADTPGGWLDQFMSGAKSHGYRVDFITLHWYGSDFSAAATGQLKRYLQATYDRYHLPIWLTEYALIKFSPSTTFPTQQQQAAFATASRRRCWRGCRTSSATPGSRCPPRSPATPASTAPGPPSPPWAPPTGRPDPGPGPGPRGRGGSCAAPTAG
jgi:hypothetical protein